LIDLHSHVLPGLDDGADDLEEALAICAAAAEDGIEVLAATPHVREDYPTSADAMEAALTELRAAGPAVRVVPGGEFDLAELARPKEELTRFGLGGNPGVILVETPYLGWPLDIAERLFHLRIAGFVAVLAHPERNPDVQHQPELLGPLVESGVLVQLTAAAVDGRLGGAAAGCAHRLIERGFAHMVASDAHAPEIRRIGMSDAVAAIGDEQLARWLTVDVPRSILDATPVPPRPETRPRRRSLFRR
jgi:protein-tyrosine phosphatase